MKIEFRVIRDDSSVVDRKGWLRDVKEYTNPNTGLAFEWIFNVVPDELQSALLRPQDRDPVPVAEPQTKTTKTKNKLSTPLLDKSRGLK